MKNIILALFTLILLHASLTVAAKDYYSVRNNDAADVRTWNSSRDGKGSTPAGFSDANDNFIIQDGYEVKGNARFDCKGSLIIETGGIYSTGATGNVTNIATFISINNGGVLKLSSKTTLIAGFMLVQGTLQNLGGEIRFNSSPAVTKL